MTEASLRLSCTCGKVRGSLSAPTRGRRLACYCDDCQAYARALGRAGQLLDAHGGTDILQTTPKCVQITQGGDLLRCLQLRPGGLLRWFSACCKTPVGNTLKSAHFAFVGIPHLFWDIPIADRNPILGPIKYRVQCKFAQNRVPEGHPSAPATLLLKFAGRLVLSGLRGEQRPSPFFAASNGEPSHPPQVLSEGAQI